MAKIKLTFDNKTIRRHAEVEYLHIERQRRVKFYGGDQAVEKMLDPSIPNAQADALERLVEFGFVVEIDEHGQCTFREES
jgi:ribosomal 50S subunit-associated protein YjgA (DUF615 family)